MHWKKKKPDWEKPLTKEDWERAVEEMRKPVPHRPIIFVMPDSAFRYCEEHGIPIPAEWRRWKRLPEKGKRHAP